MAARIESRISFASIRIEGSLLLPDVLAKVAAGTAAEQSDSSYEILPGLQLRTEIARYWQVGRTLWTRFENGRAGGSPVAVRMTFARDILTKVLGFEFDDTGDRARGGFQTATAKNGSVPLVISGDGGVDEIRSISGSSGKSIRKTPTAWLQTELNSNVNALWGLATDGMRLRLVRDNDSLTRPAMLEVDLDKIFREGLHDEFNVFWLLCHHTRFGRGDDNPEECPLEHWRSQGSVEGVTARDRLRDGVEKALFHFGTGFLEHPANAELRKRLLGGDDEEDGAAQLSVQEFHRQLLRFVYRLIFLMTAEDRGVLLDPEASLEAGELFRSGYSTDLLRERSRQRAAWDRHQDAYQGLRVLVRATASGEPRLGIPALGGIFSPEQCPDIEALPILNQRFLEGLYHLSWMEHDKALVRVNWRDMETEELGSVYESLLELTPAITENASRFYFVNGEGDETTERQGVSLKGNSRKTTGSYYTPDALVQLLLDRTLDPVIERTIAENPDDPEALLKLDIIDPSCGSGHFLLGAARRVANKLAELRTGGSATESDYREAMRDVITHSIYGVDRNDFAVELCRLALWLESIEPGRPLGFLDNRIVCGDSLVGVFRPDMLRQGIPDEAYTQLTGDDKATATAFKRWNREVRQGGGMFREYAIPAEIVAAADELLSMPSDSLGDVVAQADAYRKLMDKEDWKLFKRACDAYVSAFFVQKKPMPTQMSDAFHSVQTVSRIIAQSGVPTSETVYSTLRDGSTQPPFENAAEAVQALHWFLVFPSVMQKGGFDAVVGNPPWEVVQLSEEEYFARTAPEIAQLSGAARKRAIAELSDGQPQLFQAYELDKRKSDATGEFARASGRFELTARGKINTYALFAELFKDLANHFGRSGMIVPTGIATDGTTAAFFADLVSNRRLAALIDFENSSGTFPAVHRSYKFSILSLGHGDDAAEFSFFVTDPSQVTDERRRFRLSAQQISKINPNTKTVPVFRSERDAQLTAKIYSRVPVLVNESQHADGNPWKITFRQGLFNMTSDSGLFRTAAQLADDGFTHDGTDWVNEAGPQYVPLYEAKMIHQFDHRWATYGGPDSRDVTATEKADPSFEPTPRYWVPKQEVDARLAVKGWSRRWLMGWRDIARATDERTVIFGVMPRVAVGHTNPLFFVEANEELWCALLANMNALVLDFVARQKVGGTHLTYGYLKQFPVLPPSSYTLLDLAFIARRVLELTYTSRSMASFARDLGYYGPTYAWDDDRRALLRAELDAFYALKYGLTRDELRYILDPADIMGEDYPSETFRVLKNSEIGAYGEYRTQRLVLEAWDRMERGEQPLSEASSDSKHLEIA